MKLRYQKVIKGKINIIMSNRSLCVKCGENPQAINYKKDDKIYYRSLCDPCLTKEKKKKKPKWVKQGYQKKPKCETCGFTAKHNEQLAVVEYRDNFKTVCLNCNAAFTITKKFEIKRGDLKPDF